MVQLEEYKLQELFYRIKLGDDSAFEEFFIMYQPSVFRFLYRFTGDTQATDDILQDTFIKFWEVKEKLDLSSSPNALLYKIARNLAINYITRKPPVQPLYDSNDVLVNIFINPEKEYEQAFLMDDYQKAINTLPERCRAIFILSRYEGFSYSEIAAMLEISLQTVKNQMNKAISILKKRLSSHLD
jgi:RNA polymerase sigma-70 factor (ECF subfamily)